MSQDLLIIIPGFGGPNIEHKISILQSNLNIIKGSWISNKIYIRIFVYDSTIIQLLSKELVDNDIITWIIHKGIVGEFLIQYTKNIQYNDDTYLLILLDDVELNESVNINKMFKYYNDLSLDIISPALTHNSKYQFNYMLQVPNNDNALYITTACEFFCYFMKYSIYIENYYPYIDINNPWLWGMDMMLYNYFKLNVAIINGMTMTHHYKNISYDKSLPDPFVGQQYLFNKYNTNMENLSKQKAIRYIIYDV